MNSLILRTKQAKYQKFLVPLQLVQVILVCVLAFVEYRDMGTVVARMTEHLNGPTNCFPLENGTDPCPAVRQACAFFAGVRPVYAGCAALTLAVMFTVVSLIRVILNRIKSGSRNIADDIVNELLARELTLVITFTSFINDFPLFSVSVRRFQFEAVEDELRTRNQAGILFAVIAITFLSIIESATLCYHHRRLIWKDMVLRKTLSVIVTGALLLARCILPNFNNPTVSS